MLNTKRGQRKSATWFSEGRDYCSATTITAGPDVPPVSSIENSLLPLVKATVFVPISPIPLAPSETEALTAWLLCNPEVVL